MFWAGRSLERAKFSSDGLLCEPGDKEMLPIRLWMAEGETAMLFIYML